EKLDEKCTFSLDSYSPLALEYALDRGFKIINDITGLSDDRVTKLAARYGAKVCVMHMQGEPSNMQIDPKYEDVIDEVDRFFMGRIDKANSFGVKDLILDVGIGFGKNLEHNLLLIKHHMHFTRHKLPLLIGASRKSMINAIIKSEPNERLAGSLAIHLKAVENGASIVRCHDVKEHIQAFKVECALKESLV
ncbi:MAG: dihydropteroate synthase, partial [Sulfurospirillaceae bacterium]|nr:dihydropteroate synthase [Sulfurospirillaceae bacterium]